MIGADHALTPGYVARHVPRGSRIGIDVAVLDIAQRPHRRTLPRPDGRPPPRAAPGAVAKKRRQAAGQGPRTYLRDSGICQAFLGIESFDALLGHPVVGGNWEGFVIENILSGVPAHVSCSYYRTVGGVPIRLTACSHSDIVGRACRDGDIT